MSAQDPGRPFEEFGEAGLLWLVNAAVFHPRGYALAIHYTDGKATGWSIQGDGTERWAFAEDWPSGIRSPNDAFLAVKELLP